MNTPVLTFFNNTGGVGKTSLVYHLACMIADMGKRVVAVDLDPQANLTAAFMSDDEVESLWEGQARGATIYRCIKPLADTSDIIDPELHKISERLHLIPGDVELSSFEDALSEQWPKGLSDDNLFRPMRILSAFWHVMQKGAEIVDADLILADIGPNLGAINRSVLIATDCVVIPLGADIYSLQGLKNLGPALRAWRASWKKRRDTWEVYRRRSEYPGFILPQGEMKAIGYICQQYGVRLDRPVKAYDKWVDRIPRVYREAVLAESMTNDIKPSDDAYCLATVKHFRSLMPMGQEHRKPIFMLTAADGAIGSHANAVNDATKIFLDLAKKIGEQIYD
jgi:cellulose biosynthesis protein BcsQ